MLDDARAVWWYERSGQQAGPVTAAALGRLVAEGSVGPSGLVWKEGMPAWQPLSSVAELAEALGPAARPTVAAPPPFPRPPPPGTSATTGPALDRIPVAGTILLSIVTLGIYGWVRFYQTGAGYEALAGRRSEFVRNFWLAVGLGLAAVLLWAHPTLGLPLSVASVVFGYLALSEALKLRAEAVGRTAIAPMLTTDATHRTLYLVGAALSFVVVGVIVLLVQAVRWFEDWNAIVEALRARGGPPAAAAPPLA